MEGSELSSEGPPSLADYLYHILIEGLEGLILLQLHFLIELGVLASRRRHLDVGRDDQVRGTILDGGQQVLENEPERKFKELIEQLIE